MYNGCTNGVAFICEGATEVVFYYTLLMHFMKNHPNANIIKYKDNSGEDYYMLNNNKKKTLIRFNDVGTISNITNSGSWFENRCFGINKRIPWTVFLCYDTDSYKNDIGKFFEGDWKELRKTISKHKNCSVIDLAAQADIEDIMLLDSESVFSFLNMIPMPIPSGKKGKRKMKKNF